MHYRVGGACTTHLNPLVVLQNKAVRIKTKSDYLAHTAPLFHRYGFLSSKEIYKLNLAVYFFKNILDLIFNRIHKYDTSRAKELRLIYHKLHSTQRSINYVGPMVWNEISTEIKSLNTLKKFKASIKRYYLNK